MNISRSSATEEGEHASRQVISLEMSGSPDLKVPTPEDVNAILPKDVRVFKILEVPQGFSARRTCETRTYEFLLPVCDL